MHEIFLIYRLKHRQVFGPGFVLRIFAFFLVLQSSWRGKESWLLEFDYVYVRFFVYFMMSLSRGATDWSVGVAFSDHTHLFFSSSFLYSSRSSIHLNRKQPKCPGFWVFARFRFCLLQCLIWFCTVF